MSRATDRQLVAQARAQRGLLSAADAVRLLGRPDAYAHLVAGGLWQPVLPGVLAPAAVAVSRDLLESATMLWERRSVLSHGSAARREGIWVPDQDEVWLTTELDCPRRSGGGVRVFRTRRFALEHRTDGFHRWTPPARTLVDLAGVLTRNQLQASLLSAVRLERTTAEEVEATAAPFLRRSGTATLLGVTALWTPERESLLEDRLHDDVCSVLPYGVQRQLVLPVGNGRTVRVDVAVEALRLAFEADGLRFHSTDEQIAADQRRDRLLLARGWQTVRFREGALDDRLAVRREIAALVDRRRRDLGIA